MSNYADAGMTAQAYICELYGLQPCEKAKKQFEASYNKKYVSTLKRIIPKIFQKLNCSPISCLTMMDDALTNFELNEKKEDGTPRTLKVITANDLIVVPGIGQCGVDEFNNAFSEIIGGDWGLFSLVEKKKIVLNKIYEMLPVYLEYMYSSDYIVWIPNLRKKKKKGCFQLLKTDYKREELCLEKEKLGFTRSIRNGKRKKRWDECVTLKYDNKPIAVIQTHTNRSQLKFRLKADYFKTFTEEVIQKKCNTETLGMSAEYAFCLQYCLKLDKDDESDLKSRSDKQYVDLLRPVVDKIHKHIPLVIKHTGQRRGPDGWKDPHDFTLVSDKTLSLKTNKSDCLVCPPDIGQPGVKRCTKWLKDELNLLSKDFQDKHKFEMDNLLSGRCRSTSDDYKSDLRIEFKKAVLSSPQKMLMNYTEKLFGSDYLVWIKLIGEKQKVLVAQGIDSSCLEWDDSLLSFSRKEISNDPVNGWNVSNELYYDGLKIGSFMVHQTRTTFLFRFDLENLISLLKPVYSDKIIEVC